MFFVLPPSVCWQTSRKLNEGSIRWLASLRGPSFFLRPFWETITSGSNYLFKLMSVGNASLVSKAAVLVVVYIYGSALAEFHRASDSNGFL